jgi:iron complex transport system ATP-binding protein
MAPPLTLENVRAQYGDRVVLSDITASFDAGHITGLVGPNGAGKTSLLRACVGLLPVLSGGVRVLDFPRAHWSREALARAIAYLPQGAEAHWPVEARRLVALGRMPHRAPFAPLAVSDLAAIDGALARCDAAPFATRRVDRLSAGERSRVLLARALATGSPILLADEPAAHLDPAHQLRLMELLREEADRGTAVVVTMHDLTAASRFCDTLLVLKAGRIVARGKPVEALSDANLAEAFGVSPLRSAAGEALPVIPWTRI